MKYELPRGYLSASSIGTLMRCPKQFEFRYVHGVVSPPAAALAQGKAVHHGFETYYREVLLGKERMKGKDVAELAISAFEKEVLDTGLELKADEKDTSVSHIKAAAETYTDHVAANTTPMGVEQEVTFYADCGVQIKGYIDLIRAKQPFELAEVKTAEELTDRDKVVLDDYKFTKAKRRHASLANSLQFNLYALGTDIRDIEVVNLTKTTKTNPVPEKTADAYKAPEQDITANMRIIRHHFDGSSFPHMERIIENAARLITSGVFMPCDPESWVCSEAWCGYWSLCRGANQSEPLIFDVGADAATQDFAL